MFVTLDVTFFEDQAYYPNPNLQGEKASEDSLRDFSVLLPVASIPSMSHSKLPSSSSLPALPSSSSLPTSSSSLPALPSSSSLPTSSSSLPIMSSPEKNLETEGDPQELNPQKNFELRVYSRRKPAPLEVPAITIPTHCQESEPDTNHQSENQNSGTSDSSLDNSLPNDLDIPIAHRKGTRSCTQLPLYNFLSYHRLSHSFQAATEKYLNTEVPKNIQEALKITEWKAAVLEEMRAH